MRQSQETDALERVTAGAGSASLSATSPWCRWPPRRASRARASSWARAPSSPRYTAAFVDAPGCSFCLPSFCILRQALQNGASDAPDAFAVAATPRGVPGDDGIRYSTQTTHGPPLSPKYSLGHDEHALPGLAAFLAPAPSRAAAHLVTIWVEVRCTRCHSQNTETIKFVKPETRCRNKKTWRHRAGDTFGRSRSRRHRRCYAVDCCLRKNVSSQVMRSSSVSTLGASTPSRSRFNTAVCDATDSCVGL